MARLATLSSGSGEAYHYAMPVPSDTSPEAERVILEGYRRMTATRKLELVAALNRTLQQLASARLQKQYGPMPEKELRLRLAALRLDGDFMRDVLGWDPGVHGL
jgi:hypothetical protein